MAPPPSRLTKLGRLLTAPDRIERAAALLEIKFNSLLPGGREGVLGGCSFDDFVRSVASFDPDLAALLGAEAERALAAVLKHFHHEVSGIKTLPFPVTFNADTSLAAICYGLTRALRPRHVVETGVGYGITSAVILTALEENARGDLTSIDLPSLGDPAGEYAGLAVPPPVSKRWSYVRGTSRRRFPEVLDRLRDVDLFVSDSANVASLQCFEWTHVAPHLGTRGIAVFNNAAQRFARSLAAARGYQTWLVRQREKTSCVTAVVLPNPP